MPRISSKTRVSDKWDSSTEEEEDDDMADAKYGMRLRGDLLRSSHQSSAAENPDNDGGETRKRGRGPSKRPCLNRNALMARENRLRKKAYIEKIENKLSFYQEENKTLVSTIRKQSIDIKRLSSEVAYLKSVLNNNTNITVLLKTINDGLRKFGTHKDDTSHAPAGELNTQHKCTCYSSMKENIPKSQNANVSINSSGDPLSDYNVVQHQLSQAYTIPRERVSNSRSDPDSKDHSNVGTTNSSISQESEESYGDNVKDLDSVMPITQMNLLCTDVKKDPEVNGPELDGLSPFNMDIFEDLPKCDEIMDSIDSLYDPSSPFNEEDQLMDSTGICLHVNSDKVSLEFCPTCHLSSKNSELH